MINLLQETIKEITLNGYTTGDVKWVGDFGINFTWDEFSEIARNTDYNPGFGGRKIISTLMIVGDDWWLSRKEYDGSEWWIFNRMPSKPNLYIKPIRLIMNEVMKIEPILHIDSDILRDNFKTIEEIKIYIRNENLKKLI